MENLIIYRSEKVGKGVQLKIALPLTTSDAVTVDITPTESKLKSRKITCEQGKLLIEYRFVPKSKGYSDVVRDMFCRDKVWDIISKSAKTADKKIHKDLAEYNMFRLMWIGVCLMDDERYSRLSFSNTSGKNTCRLTFPTAVGTTDFYEEVDSYRAIRSVNTSAELVAKTTGSVVGKSATNVAGVVASLAAISYLTIAGAVIAVPAIGVAGSVLNKKLLASKVHASVWNAIKNVETLTALPNTSEYLTKMDVHGVNVFYTLDKASKQLGMLNLANIEKSIEELLVE